MHVVSIRDQIRSVADRWEASYKNQPTMVLRDGRIAGVVLARLRDMDTETATRDDVAGIIGNYGWASMICTECEEQVDYAVAMRSNSDDGCEPLYCRRCLQRAASICS